jgi:hypothetical protein
MYYFITELQKRPDGVVNNTLTTRSTLANGLSYFYDRASKAVANNSFVSVALTLQDERGTIIKNECFDTAEYQEVVN